MYRCSTGIVANGFIRLSFTTSLLGAERAWVRQTGSGTRNSRTRRSKAASQLDPKPAPVGHDHVHLRRIVFVAVASILGKLLHGIVVSEYIAMNAAQERNGNFQDRNKKVIRGFADFAGTHRR